MNIPIDWTGVQSAFNGFMLSPIVAGTTQWILGIGVGAFALSALIGALRK